jgi:uncharacterized protein
MLSVLYVNYIKIMVKQNLNADIFFENDVKIALSMTQEHLNDYSPNIYLFGSRAENIHRTTSDIDIAVLSIKKIPPSKLSELRNKFKNSNILHPVDLIDLSNVTDSFRTKVLSQGILWNV